MDEEELVSASGAFWGGDDEGVEAIKLHTFALSEEPKLEALFTGDPCDNCGDTDCEGCEESCGYCGEVSPECHCSCDCDSCRENCDCGDCTDCRERDCCCDCWPVCQQPVVEERADANGVAARVEVRVPCECDCEACEDSIQP